MTQSAQSSTPSTVTMSLRLPGWLLLAALIAFATWGGAQLFRGSSNGSSDTNPARIEVLSSTTIGGVFSADVVLESRKAIADATKGWTLNTNGNATAGGRNIPLAAAVQDGGNRNTNALRVHLFGSLPPGAVASGVNFSGPGNQYMVGAGVSQPGVQP